MDPQRGNATPPADYVTTTLAAKLAGVPARTVRYWATRGRVGVRTGKTGRLVRLSDVLDVAAMTRQGVAEASIGNGNEARPAEDTAAAVLDQAPESPRSPAPPAAASGNLTVLAALLAAHAETVAAKDQTIAAKDETIAALRRQLEASEASHRLWKPDPAPAVEPRRPWWRWW